MTGVLTKRGNLDTRTCTQGEHQVTKKAEIRSDAFINQVIPKIASKAPEASRMVEQTLTALEKTSPADSLITDFQSLELRQ